MFNFLFGLSYAIPVLHLIGVLSVLYFIYLRQFRIIINVDKNIFWLFFFGYCIVIYSYLVILINGSSDSSFVYTMFLRYFLYLLTVYIWAYILLVHFKFNEKAFLELLLLVLTFQSFCVYLSVLSPIFLEFVTKVLPLTGNIQDVGSTYQLRYRGFSNSGGDSLSLILSFGPILSFRLFVLYTDKYKYLLAFWFIFFSLIFVGRTGILVDILFVLMYLIYSPKKCLKFIIYSLMFVTPVVACVGMYLINIMGPKLDIMLDFAFEFFSGRSASGDDIVNNMLFLPSSLKTLIFGDGIYQNIDLTNYMQTDSGYVRCLFFFGLVGCFVFYGSNLWFIIKIISTDKKNKVFFLMLTILYFFVEIKRPYVLGYAYTNMFYMILFYYYLCAKINDL